jgi:formylmethanofuran dehydrogenase subunit E
METVQTNIDKKYRTQKYVCTECGREMFGDEDYGLVNGRIHCMDCYRMMCILIYGKVYNC